jgi:hypothetical protein
MQLLLIRGADMSKGASWRLKVLTLVFCMGYLDIPQLCIGESFPVDSVNRRQSARRLDLSKRVAIAWPSIASRPQERPRSPSK